MADVRPTTAPTTFDPRAALALALRWIDRNTVPHAGIRVTHQHALAYPEVSGYFIPSLLAWGESARATAYARWLVKVQNRDGSWSDPAGKSAYTFDTGQILKGLVALLDQMPELESTIRRGCAWMLTQVERNGRVTTPDTSEWGLPEGRRVNDNIHLYALEPLRVAGRRLNEPRFTAAVEQALAYYTALPDLTAFNTLSHFHAYVLEALVDLGRPDLAARGMAEVATQQSADGAVPAYKKGAWICSTGLAQYAIVWHKLGQPAPAARAFTRFCALQNPSGGFFGGYGKGANYFPDLEIAWAVKYFLDALQWHLKCAADPAAT